MAVSYNGLWKKLIDKDMKKVDLINNLGISSSTIAKMTKGEPVSLTILEKLCEELAVTLEILLVMIDGRKKVIQCNELVRCIRWQYEFLGMNTKLQY